MIEWRDIPTCPGLQASNDGQIRRGQFVYRGVLDSYGYVVVKLPRPRRMAKVHRLVCEAFHGPAPAEKPLALHRDGVRSNNVPDNLKWGNDLDNHKDRIAHGNFCHGRHNGRALLTEGDVVQIRRSKETAASLARTYGVSDTHIFRIRNNISWKHVE